MSEPVTLRRMLELIDQVVAERGEDFVYEQKPTTEGHPGHDPSDPNTECYYVWKRKPDCVAGVVYHQLGVPLSVLKTHEGQTADMIGVVEATLVALDALAIAQNQQDGGATYGRMQDIVHSKFDHLVGSDESS